MSRFLLFLVIAYISGPALAQHHHTDRPTGGKTASGAKADTTKPMNHTMPGMGSHTGMAMDSVMGMTHSLSRYLPMTRNGSGTSWHPDNTPMYAYMKHGNRWSYMLHYALYVRYTSQNVGNNDRRGYARQFGAPNWVMGMAQRAVGKRGLLQVRTMLSLDPLTVGSGGYPLLFQTGESYNGRSLIDKQHPHDLVSELSVSYSHAFSKDVDVYGYVGYPGEPALGPPAFMHRISSFGTPDAPLGHHWQDASHILFGVATAGFRYKWAKVEASNFTGREPDEHRYNFDKPRFDSYSYRLSVNPSPSLALQFSQGFLHSPEDLHPNEDVTRTTASVLHSKWLGPDRYVTSAFIWGRNSHHGEGDNSYLAESSLQIARTALYGRYENVNKTAEELGLASSFDEVPQPETPVFTINSLTLGMNYRLAQYRSTDLALGAQLTGSMPEGYLRRLYGQTPISGQVYLRLSPSLMTMRPSPTRKMHHSH